MFPASAIWVEEAFDPTHTRHLVPRASPSQAGSHRGNTSVSQFLSTLIPILVVAIFVFAAFLFFRRRLDRVYGPRTYLGTLKDNERTPQQTAGWFGWTREYKQLADEFILVHSTLDNYLFLRLFKIMMAICLIGCLITWPVLFPVNATGGGGQGGLDLLSFSNVQNPTRYYAHTFIAWIFLGFVMFLISRETLYYAQLRQAYFLSPYVTSMISSKTVLFTDVPEQYRNEESLRHVFQDVRHTWIALDPEELEDMVEDRDKAAAKLEKAEMKMISQYVKARNKGGNEAVETGENNGGTIHMGQKDRPTHRLKPIIGQKVDTIDWARGELRRLIPDVAQQQVAKKGGKGKDMSAAFIEFESVRAAQIAFQQVAHQMPFQITPRDVGMQPDQIIWKNLKKPWWMVKIIAALCTAFIAFLCLFWTIPVAFIGSLTNIFSFADSLSWLSWLDSIPNVIKGVVSGLLPVLLLSILMKLVPIICSLMARQFEPTEGAVQLKTQTWYFAFQVIQVFLITTFTSGAAAVASEIVRDPTAAPQLLAKNLPKASNFYITYFILFGLMTTALQLLNVVPLLMIMFLGKIMDKTPKKMYNRYTTLAGIGWGSFYPKYTNLGVIALSYSCIAPLVLGFATAGFTLLYLGFRYNVLFTLGTQVDTKGRAYAKALQQLTVGIYLSEICLIGLFAINSGSSLSSLGPLILMVVFLIATVIWHFQLRIAMHKLVTTLPADLLAEEYRYNGVDQYDDMAEKGQGGSDGHGDQVKHTESSGSSSMMGAYQVPRSAEPSSPPQGVFGKAKAFMLPHKYASAAVLSRHILSPHLSQPVRAYTRQEREEAYLHPALTAEPPVIWLARDQFGLSKQEISATKEVVGHGLLVTDEDASFDEKGKPKWDETAIEKAPIWEERVEY